MTKLGEYVKIIVAMKKMNQLDQEALEKSTSMLKDLQ